MNLYLLLLFGLLIINVIYGLSYENDEAIMQRIEKFYTVKELAYNTHGWCTLIVSLFLRSINLKMYEESVTEFIRSPLIPIAELSRFTHTIVTDTNIPYYLAWIMHFPSAPNVKGSLRGYLHNEKERAFLNNYIHDIKQRMLGLKLDNHGLDQGLITAFGYPVKNHDRGHATVLWLTSSNILVLIDLQIFLQTGHITLYADVPENFMLHFAKEISESNKIEILPLYNYFEKRLSRTDSATSILFMEHNTAYADEEISSKNPEIPSILKNIELVRNHILI